MIEKIHKVLGFDQDTILMIFVNKDNKKELNENAFNEALKARKKDNSLKILTT